MKNGTMVCVSLNDDRELKAKVWGMVDRAEKLGKTAIVREIDAFSEIHLCVCVEYPSPNEARTAAGQMKAAGAKVLIV